jgi:hypothetical protein
MEIELNLPRGERQQGFVDYLNIELRKRIASFSGSAGINEEGLLESLITGPFPIDQSLIQLTWRLTKDSKGTLLKLTIENTDSSVTEGNWETVVYKFVTPILVTALAKKRRKVFCRTIFYYIGPQLDGEYWLPGYRFAPAYPEDPEPYLVNGERVGFVKLFGRGAREAQWMSSVVIIMQPVEAPLPHATSRTPAHGTLDNERLSAGDGHSETDC